MCGGISALRKFLMIYYLGGSQTEVTYQVLLQYQLSKLSRHLYQDLLNVNSYSKPLKMLKLDGYQIFSQMYESANLLVYRGN
jgi:hypothetical protein